MVVFWFVGILFMGKGSMIVYVMLNELDYLLLFGGLLLLVDIGWLLFWCYDCFGIIVVVSIFLVWVGVNIIFLD